MRDIRKGHRRDRIHDDMAIVHLVAGSHLDMRPRPDANAAPDSPATDLLAKRFREHHLEPQSMPGPVGSTAHPDSPDLNAGEDRRRLRPRRDRVRIQRPYRSVTCT